MREMKSICCGVISGLSPLFISPKFIESLNKSFIVPKLTH